MFTEFLCYFTAGYLMIAMCMAGIVMYNSPGDIAEFANETWNASKYIPSTLNESYVKKRIAMRTRVS